MSKVALEEVESVLLQHKVEDASAIINDLQKIIEELKADREAEKEDKPKWEFVVIINDASGELKAQKKDEVLTAYVVQQEDGEDAATILSKLKDAATAQNEAAKRKKSRLNNLRDIFDGLKSKFLKEKKVKIKTKESVRILLTDGTL
jgi:flagellin-specific chaperone FliS